MLMQVTSVKQAHICSYKVEYQHSIRYNTLGIKSNKQLGIKTLVQ